MRVIPDPAMGDFGGIGYRWFRRWLVSIIQAREVPSAIPLEGSLCSRDDEIDRATHLLLGRPDSRPWAD
jgi:hypothetical protein